MGELINGARMKLHAFRPAFSKVIGRSAIQGVFQAKRVYAGVKFDKEKYDGVIFELEEALRNGGSCLKSTESYTELKRMFG